ncbi:hypothetical protein [Phreatobacter oligotrophus]|uniref:Uncharacterized protein n=1 Tax=Phreatobacter oligotrophus TaxID=1122261 RepID=A0A2T4ZGW2_9HYPH|nr:hypothetical protein [Phreatobacter oligotrophus]PTM61157.1 hypothetical protein C8P69_102544 [Phreatobacter oligotrophus]
MIPIARHRIVLRAMRPVIRSRNQPAPISAWREVGHRLLVATGLALLVVTVLAARVALTWQG